MFNIFLDGHSVCLCTYLVNGHNRTNSDASTQPHSREDFV